MDVLNCLKCEQHNQQVLFVQVKELASTNKDKRILYCVQCIADDSTFLSGNCIYIQSIIESGDKNIFDRWPPLHDDQVLFKLIEQFKHDKSKTQIIQQIKDFFQVLKIQFNERLHKSEKIMINAVNSFPYENNQILEKYQEISNIKEFSSYFTTQSTNVTKIQEDCRDLIDKFEQEKGVNQNKLQILLEKILSFQKFVDLDKIQRIQKQILELADQINLGCFDQQSSVNQIDEMNGVEDNNSVSIEQTDILPELEMVKTELLNSLYTLQITKNGENNQIQISVNQDGDVNCISNLILNRELNYIFRFELSHDIEMNCYYIIGLIRDEKKNKDHGSKDNLSFRIGYFAANKTYDKDGRGIQNIVKGNLYDIESIKSLELRVSIKDKILEIRDYPNYHHIVSLTQSSQEYLSTYSNIKLYLNTSKIHQTITITHAFTCSAFPN